MMPCRQPEHGARVQSTAEIATNGNVGPQANAHRLLQCLTKLRRIICIRSRRGSTIHHWIVKVPVLMKLDMLIGGNEVVSGRNLKHPLEERTHWMAAVFDAVIDGLRIPIRGH